MKTVIFVSALVICMGEIAGQNLFQRSPYHSEQKTERRDDVSLGFVRHSIPFALESSSIRKQSLMNEGRVLTLFLDSIVKQPATYSSGNKFIYEYDVSGNVIAAEEYTLHPQVGIWTNQNRYFYNYDNQGRPILRIRQIWLNTIPQQWGNSRKEEWFYDTLGNITEYIMYAGNQNQWIQNSRELNIYDTNGYLIESQFQAWETNQWIDNYRWIFNPDSLGRPILIMVSQYENNTWSDIYKLEREYTTTNDLLKEIRINFDTINNQWSTVSKQENFYNSSELISDYYKSYWVNGFWNHSFHKKYTYNAHNQLLNYLEEVFINQTAQNYTHHAYTYDSMNNLIQYLEEKWDTTNSQWVGRIKNDHIYDNQGNRTNYIRYNWNNGQWTPSRKGDLNYDTSVVLSDLILPSEPYPTVSLNLISNCYEMTWINMLEQLTEYYWQNNQWHAESPSIYYYSNQTSSIQALPAERTILVFPNPTKGNIYLGGLHEYRNGKFELFDSTGRKLQHTAIQPDGLVDLSDIPTGVYIYRFISEENKQTGKIIKH